MRQGFKKRSADSFLAEPLTRFSFIIASARHPLPIEEGRDIGHGGRKPDRRTEARRSIELPQCPKAFQMIAIAAISIMQMARAGAVPFILSVAPGGVAARYPQL
jgi:hypothetical protein